MQTHIYLKTTDHCPIHTAIKTMQRSELKLRVQSFFKKDAIEKWNAKERAGSDDEGAYRHW